MRGILAEHRIPTKLAKASCYRGLDISLDAYRGAPSERGKLTSLRFCCAGWALTRGRELSGERPRTLI